MSKYDPSKSTTISGIISLSITLLTVCIVPIDVFLVSFMKNSDGSFKVRLNIAMAGLFTETVELTVH
jgi:LMBR1 domain-containing protein 1